jgi:acetyltransferase-like isoleucine patch superfamily enzyme
MKTNLDLLEEIQNLLHQLMIEKRNQYQRVLPFGDYFVDRSEKAKFLGFGQGTSVYDNVLILGDVKIGENTWVGPNVILDGSGGLKIGSHCSISAGVQIYSHDSVNWAVSAGASPYEYAKTSIEDNCYIGPNVVIAKGVSIGEGSIIGANSLVLTSIPPHSKAYGSPCKVVGEVKV